VTLPLVSFPTLGWQVIDWIEGYLVHGPGDVQGDPIQIDDEVAVHICWLYRVWPKDHPLAGRRLIHRGIFSRPKGRMKSELAGMLVCAEALGPVRCDGFASNGDPVGHPVRYPFIRCLATEEEQSGNTYDNVHYMLQEGRVAAEYALDVGLTRTFIKEPGGGEIVPSTAASASKEGGKETFAVADETHLYVLPQLHQMYRTVARNTGKRKEAEPWMYDTTTAYQPGEHSVAEIAAERYEGTPPEELTTKKGILYDHRQGAVPKRFGDDRSLIKAMKEGYGPAVEWIDFRGIVRRIRDAEDPEEEAFRFWLNIPRKAASQWLSPDEIRAILRPESIVEPGTLVALGFDGSESDDHSALFGCTREGLLFSIGVWTPSGEDIDWHAEVNEAVDWAFDNFEVVQFYADPAYWIEEVSKWRSRYGDHKRYGQRVGEFWTGGRSESKFAVACGACRTMLRQGTATLDPIPLRTEPQTRDGKPLVVWHFENARTRKVRVRMEEETEDAYTVKKERKGSPFKIDSVPAAVLARRARDDAEKLGLFDQPVHARAEW
jgi:hypothetical protein